MSENKDSGSPKTTRRKFLIGAAAVAGEAAFGPVGKIGEYLASLDMLPEGNPAQRLGGFEKLMHLVARDPSEENRDLAVAWIKFNLAEVYAASNNLPLSAQFTKHFLYGLGQSVDISEQYKKIIISQAENYQLQNREAKTEDDIISNFFEFSLMSSPNLHLVSAEDVKAIKEGRPPSSVTLGALVQSEDPDIRTSLHHYTVSVTGQTAKALGGLFGTDITLNKPTFNVFDRYDWEERYNGAAVHMDVKKATTEFLGKLGVVDVERKLIDVLGEQNAKELSKHQLSIGDREGAILAKKGFAREFDVRASLSSSKPISLSFR